MSNVLSASAKGATFLILTQVGSRALTFIINQVLLRYLSPELLGAATQLELYLISVQYFARESLRVALQRQTGNAQAIVNVSYISVVLGMPLAYFLAKLYARSSLPQVQHIEQSLFLYGVAAMIELLAEPCFVIVQQKMAYKVRAAAETIATIGRCLVTFTAVLWAARAGRDIGVLPFAMGQMSYSILLLAIYYARTVKIASREHFSLLPKRIRSNDPEEYIASHISRPLLTLGLNLYLQSGIKYILTQGDAILITSLTTLHDQGAYALASNYGGLVARMLFQPIEEASRNLFAKLCASKSASSPAPPSPFSASSTTTKISIPTTEKPIASSNIHQARTTLRDILHFYLLISLTAGALGPSLAPPLLSLIAGRKWADTGAGAVLAAYCYYIPLLALNGVTEAFVSAVASNADLRWQSALMGVNFGAFACAAYIFLKVLGAGATGLVWANCANMGFRVAYNGWFIKNFFAQNAVIFDFSDAMPSIGTLAAAIAAGSVIRTQISPSDAPLSALVKGGAIAGVFAVAMLVFERRFFGHCYRMIRPTAAGGVSEPASMKKRL